MQIPNKTVYILRAPNNSIHITPEGLDKFCEAHNLKVASLVSHFSGGKVAGSEGWTILDIVGENPLITSLLQLDLYKISMMQVVWKHYPSATTEFVFKCRNEVELGHIVEKLEEEIEKLCRLRFTTGELEYLKSLSFIQPGFVEYLSLFHLDKKFLKITKDPFTIRINGPWINCILFEIFLLSLVSEIHYQNTYSDKEQADLLAGGNQALTTKIAEIKARNKVSKNGPIQIVEFGTRRRFSSVWQQHVLTRLLDEVPESIFGTSNVELAMKHNVRAIGTMAHEYLQAFQALGPRLIDSQKAALETWVQTYRGDLGIALTDVICMDAFLRDFDLYYTKLFDGLRHDSGCPFEWAKKAIAHYKRMGVDPKSKALVFSDGLNIEKAFALHEEFGGQIKCSFGIGTNLTNDIPGVTPLNIVIKMTRCNDSPVAKLSDSPGKSMCEDQEYLTYLKKVFNYNIA